MATNGQKEPKIVTQSTLILTLERAVESGSVSKKLLLELVKEFGLKDTQDLVLARTTALYDRAEAMHEQVEAGLVLFTDEFAKETGNWPRPADYFGA